MRSENTEVPTMTASDYFSYCRIAYLAGKRKGEEVDESLSGREMYMRYADGRDEGLLDVDETSGQEFADWIDGTHPKRRGGGHHLIVPLEYPAKIRRQRPLQMP